MGPAALERDVSKQAAILQELRRDAARGMQVRFGDRNTMSYDIEDGDTLIISGKRLVAGPNAEDTELAQGYAEDAQRALSDTQ